MEEIKSRKNHLIMHIRKLGTDRAYRRSCHEFLCEGEKLLKDALTSGALIKTALTAAEELPDLPENVRKIFVPSDIIESISSMKSPRPVIFTCAMPEDRKPVGTKHVLLNNLQDPGNVGTIIRTANALGMDSVILLGECADPYSPKSVRASMGAVFRQHVAELSMEELATFQSESGLRVFGTFPDGGMEDVRSVDFSSGIIAIGNEGAGLGDEMRALCDCNITIPMREGCESLNAASAATVLMWEMCRKDL